ncbi:hypothetical protein TrVE_jg9133, partial [Triparma verrucosa]
PFILTVEPEVTDASKTEVLDFTSDIVAGEKFVGRFKLYDIYQNPTNWFGDRLYAEPAGDLVKSDGVWEYSSTLTPTTSGTYTIEISLGSNQDHINGSPFQYTVKADVPDITKCVDSVKNMKKDFFSSGSAFTGAMELSATPRDQYSNLVLDAVGFEAHMRLISGGIPGEATIVALTAADQYKAEVPVAENSESVIEVGIKYNDEFLDGSPKLITIKPEPGSFVGADIAKLSIGFLAGLGLTLFIAYEARRRGENVIEFFSYIVKGLFMTLVEFIMGLADIVSDILSAFLIWTTTFDSITKNVRIVYAVCALFGFGPSMYMLKEIMQRVQLELNYHDNRAKSKEILKEHSKLTGSLTDATGVIIVSDLTKQDLLNLMRSSMKHHGKELNDKLHTSIGRANVFMSKMCVLFLEDILMFIMNVYILSFLQNPDNEDYEEFQRSSLRPTLELSILISVASISSKAINLKHILTVVNVQKSDAADALDSLQKMETTLPQLEAEEKEWDIERLRIALAILVGTTRTDIKLKWDDKHDNGGARYNSMAKRGSFFERGGSQLGGGVGPRETLIQSLRTKGAGELFIKTLQTKHGTRRKGEEVGDGGAKVMPLIEVAAGEGGGLNEENEESEERGEKDQREEKEEREEREENEGGEGEGDEETRGPDLIQ